MVTVMLSDLKWEDVPIKVGDHVKKKIGFKFVGTVRAIYYAQKDWYAVVELDPSEVSDGLQHIYKVSQLEVI